MLFFKSLNNKTNQYSEFRMRQRKPRYSKNMMRFYLNLLDDIFKEFSYAQNFSF